MDDIKTQILIVGSGGNGISTAALLSRRGYNDFLIVTKHPDFGGAWLQNDYPGCEVDNPSAVYQFEFEPNHRWSALYAKQAELLEYMKSVAAKYGLYERTRFNEELLQAKWSEEHNEWVVRTSAGLIRATVLVLATGFLEEPIIPDIPGLGSFRGRIFHSSRWPEGYTGTGDCVAVVGSGSSAIQIVPQLQRVAEQVIQFQRTPTWVVPKNNRLLTAAERELWATSVGEQQRRRAASLYDEEENWSVLFLGSDPEKATELEAMSRRFLAETVREPALRAVLTPSHRMGCKRPLISDDYYSSLNASNVIVVPQAAAKIGPLTVTADGGEEFTVDTIVLATGFFFGGHILHRVCRRDGRTVAEHQDGHPRSYKAISIAGCPNLFVVGGSAPNGQIWNGIFPGQAAAGYIAGALDYLSARDIHALDVRESEEISWKMAADSLLDQGPTVLGGCTNYSQDQIGHNKAAWPGSLESMREALAVFDPEPYDLIG